MPHDHDHPAPQYNTVFAVGVGLNVVYVAAEATFGWWGNSLALLADAGHNLSDVLGLLLAWGAYLLTRIEPSQQRTYGWRSTSILAAVFNGLLLLVAVGGIAWEAVRRFADPQPVVGLTVIAIAALGVVINTATALLFVAGRHGDLNIKGAFLHMAADAAVSLGVVLAGIAIYFTGAPWIDPLTSLVVAAIILLGTWGLLRDATNLALHAVPPEIDMAKVSDFLQALPGVTHVHDLHVWAMSTTETALTAHLVKPELENDDTLLAEAADRLNHDFGIHHVTLQIERDADNARCKQIDPAKI